MHYLRWKKHGDPNKVLNVVHQGTEEERFDQKVAWADDLHGCHVWTEGTTPYGYGRFTTDEHKQVLAHVYAWTLVNGPVPEGMHVLHTCDNPPCVNVDHLFLGTQSDNMRDMMGKGRGKGQFETKTHCIHGHEFDEKNTILCKNGTRQCRECARKANREWQRRRRAKERENR